MYVHTLHSLHFDEEITASKQAQYGNTQKWIVDVEITKCRITSDSKT